MTTNSKLQSWVEEMRAMCRPERVQWCDGSPAEYQEMMRLLASSGSPAAETALKEIAEKGSLLRRGRGSALRRLAKEALDTMPRGGTS